MKWYLKVVRDNYANFQGRARRQEYWMFNLFQLIFVYGGMAILGGIGYAIDIPFLVFIIYIYILATLIPSIAVSVRRLHDVGKSGWFLLISLIPIIGGIWIFVLSVTEGDKGTNEYGPDPKAENVEEIDEIGKPQVEA
ncbi:MAG: DUF805 domain-containing protein [Algibacter sp.]